MVRRIITAISFLVLRCVLKSFLSFSYLFYHVLVLFGDPNTVAPSPEMRHPYLLK
jgi:hypothetical protein